MIKRVTYQAKPADSWYPCQSEGYLSSISGWTGRHSLSIQSFSEATNEVHGGVLVFMFYFFIHTNLAGTNCSHIQSLTSQSAADVPSAFLFLLLLTSSQVVLDQRHLPAAPVFQKCAWWRDPPACMTIPMNSGAKWSLRSSQLDTGPSGPQGEIFSSHGPWKWAFQNVHCLALDPAAFWQGRVPSPDAHNPQRIRSCKISLKCTYKILSNIFIVANIVHYTKLIISLQR